MTLIGQELQIVRRKQPILDLTGGTRSDDEEAREVGIGTPVSYQPAAS